MKDFDIAKFLRENQLGSYGILNHYVDIKPLKEEEVAEDVTPEEIAEIPYEGPDAKLDGFGDEFDQAETVSEEEDDAMKYPLTVFINAVKAAKAAGVSKDRMLYFIDVFGEGIEEEWNPDQTVYPEEMISKAIDKLKYAGISIKQIKDFVDKQLVRDADSAVFENISDQDKLDSMLADSHPDIGSAADIISSTIKVLRNEKFSDQEIIDFLASLDSLDPSNF